MSLSHIHAHVDFKLHPSSRPLLFPCGTLRKDTLPVVLTEAGIAIAPQICYETVPHPLIEKTLNEMVIMIMQSDQFCHCLDFIMLILL